MLLCLHIAHMYILYFCVLLFMYLKTILSCCFMITLIRQPGLMEESITLWICIWLSSHNNVTSQKSFSVQSSFQNVVIFFIFVFIMLLLFIHENFEYPLKSTIQELDKCKWYFEMKWEKLSWTIIKHKNKAKVNTKLRFEKVSSFWKLSQKY